MKTLVIVSSYAESCGNAAFTKVLHDSINQSAEVKVEVVSLDLKILQSMDHKIRCLADQYIVDISESLKKFDAVNIQMEAGLYGTLPRDIVWRVKKIMGANPNTTVTLHAPRLIPTSMGMRSGIKKIFKLQIKAGLKEIITHGMADINIRLNRKIISYAVKKKFRLIVHTLRAQQQIEQLYNYKDITVHPLKIVPENFKVDPLLPAKLRENLDLVPEDILIGMFGFISAYKGHLDAIHALRSLPSHYKLLIFGRQHPQTLKSDGKIDPYLLGLIDAIEKKPNLLQRVFFLGELSDSVFLQMASCVDVAWLPYYENGQDGSGIASICMDVCQRVLCSASFAFDELFKLIPYSNQMRFDVGNALELATKTKLILKQDMQPLLSSDDEDLKKYTLETQVKAYISDI